MSVVSIRAALETALAAMSPALATAWENKFYEPVPGTPYQRVALLFATPDNAEISASHVELGFMQVTLCYPTPKAAGDIGGSGLAAARAELIRTTFYRGASFSSGGLTTTVLKTPEIMPAYIDGDRYCVPVRIPFLSQIQV